MIDQTTWVVGFLSISAMAIGFVVLCYRHNEKLWREHLEKQDEAEKIKKPKPRIRYSRLTGQYYCSGRIGHHGPWLSRVGNSFEEAYLTWQDSKIKYIEGMRNAAVLCGGTRQAGPVGMEINQSMLSGLGQR